MAGHPKVTVVLPVYNAASTLSTAIQSILNQTFTDFEFIIINDGSKDSSSSVINSFTDPRIRSIDQDNRGVAPTMNRGIDLARGEYIVRMDADDVSISDRLAIQVKYLDHHENTDLVATQVTFEGQAENLGLQHYIDWQNNLISTEEIFLNRFVDAPIINPTIMVRKKAFELYGKYSEDTLPEDFELWLRWLDHGAVLNKIPQELLVWRDRNNRLTRTHPNYDKSLFFETKARYFTRWFESRFPTGKPELWILGTGRLVYRRTKYLSEFGLTLAGFVDFKSSNQNQRLTIGYEQIRNIKNPFFLSYVSDRQGRERIAEFLKKSGFIEGQHFYMMA